MTRRATDHKADQYISPGGRGRDYGQPQFTDDLICAASFLVWAEEDRAFFGGERARDAYQAMMRMLDMDPIKLRKIIRGEE